VIHAEYIDDVAGSSNFGVSVPLFINPGMSMGFPWLSRVARQFEEYKFNKLAFKFRSTSGSFNGATQALGKVVMCTDYNVDTQYASSSMNTAVWTNTQAMEAYQGAVSTTPMVDAVHHVDCRANLTKNFLVRRGVVQGLNSAAMYDLGFYCWATVGQSNAVNLGEMWSIYDVTFHKPRIDPMSKNLSSEYTHFQESPAGSATAAAPLGTTGGVTAAGVDGLPEVTVDPTAPTTSLLFSRPGTYYIDAGWIAGNVAAAPAFTPGANLTRLNGTFVRGQSGARTGCVVNAENFARAAYVVTTSGTTSANRLVISGNTSMTGGTTDIRVFRVPDFGVSTMW